MTAEQPEVLTLGELRKKARRDSDDEEVDDFARRYRTLHFVSSGERLTGEPDLRTHYCAVCGRHNLIIDGKVGDLPAFENTRVLDVNVAFHKSYMKKSDHVLIDRPQGVERRIMFRCGECELPLGFRVRVGSGEGEDDEVSSFFYLFEDSLVLTQAEAEVYSPPEC